MTKTIKVFSCGKFNCIDSQIVEQWDCDIEEDGRLKLSFNNGHSKHSIYVSFCPFCGGEKDTKEVL